MDLRVFIGSHMPNSKLCNATESRNAMQSTCVTKANTFFLLVTTSPINLPKDCVKYYVFNLEIYSHTLRKSLLKQNWRRIIQMFQYFYAVFDLFENNNTRNESFKARNSKGPSDSCMECREKYKRLWSGHILAGVG